MPDDSWLQLVDFGDLLADEPVFDGMQEVEIFPPIRAKYAGVIARGNVPRTVSFSRIYELETPNDARRFELDQMALLDGMVESSLYIELKDSDTYVMSGAILVGVPRVKDTNELPAEYSVIDYTIYGGALNKQASQSLDLFVIDGSDYFVLVD